MNSFVSASVRQLQKAAEENHLLIDELVGDRIVKDIFANVEAITKQVLINHNKDISLTNHIDNLLTSRIFGYPIMLLVLGVILWITIAGANVPSQMIASILFDFQEVLTEIFMAMQAPEWLHGVLVLGLYRSVAWVVSVMLPPMAIFFPLFTLLEDLGYLPRVAFNLDHLFKKARACGKQSLTMCMGFGCNAAGVVACRIIDSPRERLIAVLTNNFVPCNGRFPTLIAIGTIFIAGAAAPHLQAAINAGIITGLILIGIAVTFLVSWMLSQTLLKGEASSMVLELPPYRRPQFGAVLYRSIIDRTIFVLRRAITVAAPAGILIWVLANINVSGMNIISYLADFLQPVAHLIGLDGYILLAFILGLPANEIVIPILIMSYMSSGYMIEMNSLKELQNLLYSQGWTWLTALCTMLFSLLHWPCGTTLLTCFKETGSKKWTLLFFLIPTIISVTLCFTITQIVRVLELI